MCQATGELVPSVEACDILGIDRSTLSRWAKDGKIRPALKLGGLRGPMWFTRADVEALAAERAA